ncbi:unnamed protein product [Onchocerca flexuosa]|uniref:Orfan n=1 Tax=Onchocerca flexuosa TaxID=387005 RepID=A0A183HA21_9BILA|nr:unnamed protein product [Onchocerca flexuosa]
MVIDNGTLYQTCNCCGHLCDEEIYQPDSGDMGTMLANVNQFWIITDISVTSIIFMLLIIFANFCIFIIIFDDLTYLCIFMWAYLAKLWDFDHKLPQRCKLKPVAQFLKKHKLLDHCVPRNLFIFTKNHSTSFLNTKSARENRYLTRLRRDYQNIRTQETLKKGFDTNKYIKAIITASTDTTGRTAIGGMIDLEIFSAYLYNSLNLFFCKSERMESLKDFVNLEIKLMSKYVFAIVVSVLWIKSVKL